MDKNPGVLPAVAHNVRGRKVKKETARPATQSKPSGNQTTHQTSRAAKPGEIERGPEQTNMVTEVCQGPRTLGLSHNRAGSGNHTFELMVYGRNNASVWEMESRAPSVTLPVKASGLGARKVHGLSGSFGQDDCFAIEPVNVRVCPG